MAAPNAWCRRCWRHIRAGAGWAACGGSTGWSMTRRRSRRGGSRGS